MSYIRKFSTVATPPSLPTRFKILNTGDSEGRVLSSYKTGFNVPQKIQHYMGSYSNTRVLLFNVNKKDGDEGSGGS